MFSHFCAGLDIRTNIFQFLNFEGNQDFLQKSLITLTGTWVVNFGVKKIAKVDIASECIKAYQLCTTVGKTPWLWGSFSMSALDTLNHSYFAWHFPKPRVPLNFDNVVQFYFDGWGNSLALGFIKYQNVGCYKTFQVLLNMALSECHRHDSTFHT